MMASLFDFDALPSFRKGGASSSPHRRPSPSANASEFSSPTRTYSHENNAAYQNYGKTYGTGPEAALYAAGSNGGHAKIDGAVVQQRFLGSPSPRKPLDPLANMGGGTTGGGLFSPFHRKVMAGDSKRGDEDGDLEDYQSAAPLTQPRLLAPPARAQAAGPMEAAPSADSYVRLEDIMNAPLFPPVLPSTAPVLVQARAHMEGKGAPGRHSRSSSLEPPARGTAKPVAFRKSYDIVLGGAPGVPTAPPGSSGGREAATSQPNRRPGSALVKSRDSALAGPGNGSLLQSFRSRLAALAEEVEDLSYEVHTGQVSPRREGAHQRLSSLTLPAVTGVASPIAPLLPSYGRIRAPSTTAASLGSELPSLASPPNEAADAQDMPLLYGAAGAPQAVHAAIGAMFAEAHGMSSSRAAGQDKGTTATSPSRQVPPTSTHFYQNSGNNNTSNSYTTSSHLHAGGGPASADMSDLRLRAAALIPVTMAQVASDIVTGKVWERDRGDRGRDGGGGPSGGMPASPKRAPGPPSFSSPSHAPPTSQAWDRQSQSPDKRVDQQWVGKEAASAAALQAFPFEDTHARGFEEAGALLSTPMPGSRHAASSAVRTSSRPQPRTAARAASLPPLPRDPSPARSPEQRAAGIAEQQAAAEAGKLPRYLAPTKARMESMSAQAALLAELSQRGEKDMRRHPPGSGLGQGARRASIAGSSAEKQVKLAQQRRSSLGALPTASSSGSQGGKGVVGTGATTRGQGTGTGQAAGKGGGSPVGAAQRPGRAAPRSTSVPPRAAEARSKGQPALPPPVPSREARAERERAVVTVRGRQPAGGTRPGSGTAAHSSASHHAPGARAAILRRDSAASSLLQDAPRAMDLLRRMDAARKGMLPSSPPPTLAEQRVHQSARFAEEGVGGTGTVLSASPPDLSGREFIASRLAHLQQQTQSKSRSSPSPRPARSEQARSTVKKQRREASSSQAKSPPTRLAVSPPRAVSPRAGSASQTQGADEGKARLLSSLLLKALNGTGAAGEAALKSIHSGSVSPAVLTALLPLLDKLDESEGSLSKLRTRTAYLEALLRQLAEQTAKASASDQAALNGLHTLSTLQDLLGPFGHGLARGGGKGSPVREAAEAASRAAADKAVLDIMNVGSSPSKAAGSTPHPDGMAYKDVLAAALSLSPAGTGHHVAEHGPVDPIGRAMERVDAKFQEADPHGQQSPRPASTSYAQAQARADVARANELGTTLSPLRNAADIRKALAEARQAAETAAAYTRDMSSVGGPADESDPLRAPIPSAASVLAGLGLDSEGRVSSTQGAALLDAAVQKHKLEQSRGMQQGGQPGALQPAPGPGIDALRKQAVAAAARVPVADTNGGIAAAKALVAAKLGKAEETLASSAAVMAKEAKASGHPSLDDMIGHLLPGYGGGRGGTGGAGLPTMHGVIAGMVRESQLGQDADVRKALADAPFVSMRMPLPAAPPGHSKGAASPPSRVGAKAHSDSRGRCAECETVTASRQCHECNDAFCDMCYTALHRKGARKEHLWTRVDESRGETDGAPSPARPSASTGPTDKQAPAFMSPGTLAQFDIADPLALERMVQKAVAESGSAYMAATASMAVEMRKPLATSSSTSAASDAAASNARAVDPHPMLSMPTVQLGPGLSSLSLDLFKRVYAASGGPEDMHKKAQLLTDAAKAREEAAALGIADPLSLALTIGQGGGLVLTSGGEADVMSTQLAKQAETSIAVAVGHATDRAKAGELTISSGKDARSSSSGKASSIAAPSAIPRPATPAVDVVAPTAAGPQQSVLTPAQLAQLSKSLLSGLDEAPANGRSRGAPSTSSSYRRVPSTARAAQNRAAQSTQRFLARMQAAAGKREAS